MSTEHRKKKPNSFSVMPTKNGRNIVIELHDFAECERPSVKKDLHMAVGRCLMRIINEHKELNHALR